MARIANVWTETFRIRSYETDPGGAVSIQSICNYLQEAAGNHASDLGVSIDHLTDRNLTWVLSRLRVEMITYPAWRDDVVVETWPSGVERLFAMREFILRRPSGAVIVRATSAWLLIDRERRRPVRLPEDITSLELPDRERPLKELPESLPDVSDDATAQQIRVRYSDLDLNGHVNNVRYADWSIEGVPAGVLADTRVAVLDLHFRAESTYGDTVTVRTEALGRHEGRATYGHVILLEGRELARARTSWSKQ